MTRAMSKRLSLLAAAALSGVLTAATATTSMAQAFPEKPLTMVVPAGTGGSNDRAARLMAGFLSEELGQPVTVINRPGGGNLLGHVYFQQQPVDGYTILRTTAVPYMTVNQLVQGADFVIEDFQPINLSDIDTSIIAVSAGSRFDTIEDLIAEIRANPGTVSVGVQPTSADMINMSIFLEAIGLSKDDVRIVTYDSGGPVRNGIAGEQFDVGVIGERGLRVMAEQIKPLMVFSDEPIDVWDAPAVREVTSAEGVAEYPNILSGSVRGYFVHASLATEYPDRYQRLVEAFSNISENEDAIAAHIEQKMTIDWFGPERSVEIVMREHQNLTNPEYLSVLKPE